MSFKKILFGLLAILFSFGNFFIARKIDFESLIFCPFRYEGLLFFKNALLDKTGAFFFLRDWSTSFSKAEHPLLYFHNLDLVHFFAGFVQTFVPYGKSSLFFVGLAVSLAGLGLIFKFCFRHFNNMVTLVFLLAIVLPLKAFLLAPQNLFIAVSLLCLVWHLKLLQTIASANKLTSGFYIELIACFGLAAMAETNQTLLMILITGLLALYFSSFTRESLKRLLRITFFSALPLVCLRVLQLIAVKAFGFWEQYAIDMAYTSKIKVNSSIDIAEAIVFYAQHALTYFGDGAPQRIATNLRGITAYYQSHFGHQFWLLTLACAIFLVGRKKIISIFYKKDLPGTFDPCIFLACYLCAFTMASYLMVFLTGDAILKIALSSFGVLDYTLVYSACFICLIPALSLEYLGKEFPAWKTRIIFFSLALIFAFFARHSLIQTRWEHFSYKKALAKAEKGSDIITNYEPSVVSIESGSRANMAWQDRLPSSCDLLDSCRVLKMYRTTNAQRTKHLYMFLAFFPPYGGEKQALEQRLCLDKLQKRLLYEDRNFGLYEIFPSKQPPATQMQAE